MYDIRKRRGFQTVGELRAMLNHLPARTRVTICGDLNCFFHEEQDGSLICLDCEDLNGHYEDALETTLAEETPTERDKHLESLWAELADVPMNPEAETMEAPFCIFPTGTSRDDIWRWFDQFHSKGVAHLLHGDVPPADSETSLLEQFIQQEVPFRLVDVLDIPSERISNAALQDCVAALNSDTSVLFNYDRIDDKLREILKQHGIGEEEMG